MNMLLNSVKQSHIRQSSFQSIDEQEEDILQIKRMLKRVFPGVSWKNPVLNLMFKAADPFDYVVRSSRGLSKLPPYSVRVRSNGVTRQFGGEVFSNYGKLLANLLKEHAGLNSRSSVLEIGCGCGRTAFSLAEVLVEGRYVGMDIEKLSLDTCKQSSALQRSNFTFDFLNVQNNEYNPDGEYTADTYVFPYESGSYDIIFLVSVFTHMLTADVKNYIDEISRLLKPGGFCMLTTFLMDNDAKSNGLSFMNRESEHYFHSVEVPEMAVGYVSKFYVDQFAKGGVRLAKQPLWGSWRANPAVVSSSGFAQDILFFVKGEAPGGGSST